MEFLIRAETPADYRTVEDVTRRAFWNLNQPGCDEHYLVHEMRTHCDLRESRELSEFGFRQLRAAQSLRQ
jgi:predicted N-acetyltransferase YhbS